MKILLIGDESRTRRLLSFGLVKPDDHAAAVNSAGELARLSGLRTFEVALLDWEMRDAVARELLDQLQRLTPTLPVVVLTSRGSRVPEVRARGAVEALLKPIVIDEARATLERCAQAALVEPAATPPAPEPPVASEPVAPLATQNEAQQRQFAIAAKVAPTGATLLLLGENGTGKTRLARQIHERSTRGGRAFVTVNCPCLQAQLLESELFGHVRGAFTGAVADAAGLVEAAEHGTLFFDEVGDLPALLQPKLLRLLEDHCYERVGEAKTRTADIRIIAATNRDLRAEVAAGRFREDLFYRLNVISIEMLPLRRRPEDILPTAELFLAECARAAGRTLRGFAAGARTALQRHSWPGNLRELHNYIERAAILCEGEMVELDDLPELGPPATVTVPQVGDFVTLASLEDAHIRRVVERTGNFMQAARLLGINKTTLYRRRRRTYENTVAFREEAAAVG
ncbi:MAG TPA: sigma-54 dependent transcriptional regulator [Opitutaceae bacterium]|nr:sigma-54 dependent transcriptional regulator [Opitutaceae bacterium]